MNLCRCCGERKTNGRTCTLCLEECTNEGCVVSGWLPLCTECGGDPAYIVSIGMGVAGPCQTCLGRKA